MYMFSDQKNWSHRWTYCDVHNTYPYCYHCLYFPDQEAKEVSNDFS